MAMTSADDSIHVIQEIKVWNTITERVELEWSKFDIIQ